MLWIGLAVGLIIGGFFGAGIMVFARAASLLSRAEEDELEQYMIESEKDAENLKEMSKTESTENG